MFDCGAFLKGEFGDPDGVVGLLGKHGSAVPQREAVRKWFERRSLPGEWFPILLITLERETGAPVSVERYATGVSNDIFS